jgi:hypothetical protein
MSKPPTTAKLRHDIDRGRGGDKVDNIDPAAAPLGTDEEAAGTPPSPEAVKLAHDQEIRATAATPEARQSGRIAIFVAIIGVVALALGLAIWLF